MVTFQYFINCANKIINCVFSFIAYLKFSNGQYQKQFITREMDKPEKPNFKLLETWFIQNGGRHKKIIFPTRFPPTSYIGICASQDIKLCQVFLAVPKKLRISPSKARESELNSILQEYGFNEERAQQNQFNVLLLYLIWQINLGEDSFYFPYFQALGKPQIMLTWPDEDIQNLEDPYISVQYINEQKTFMSTYKKFKEISTKYPAFFKEPISQQFFKECYFLVLTRSFGWGLPETMMIPYADFLNHDCCGAYHYVLNRSLEDRKVKKFEEEYVIKRNELDLSLLGIKKDNLQQNYIMQNSRQKSHHNPLKQKQISSSKNKKLVADLQKLLQETYEVDLQLSSDSQDNDTEKDEEEQGDYSDQQQEESRSVRSYSQNQNESKSRSEKPDVNRQFDEGVTFSWWDKTIQSENYFIVAAHKNITKGDQIFNSYGRRSNRFLLIWYGFTIENNKYDSVPFRFWDQKVSARIGKNIFTRYLTNDDFNQGIRLGNERISCKRLSDEFRLKKNRLNLKLMAQLRFQIIQKKNSFKNMKKQLPTAICEVSNLDLEKKMLNQYFLVLVQLKNSYQPQKKREPLSDDGKNYFASILMKSNKQILSNHERGVNFLKQLIQKLQKGDRLIDLYRGNATTEEALAMKVDIEEGNQIRYENRRFTLDYLKLLGKYLENRYVEVV